MIIEVAGDFTSFYIALCHWSVLDNYLSYFGLD